jgi:hypothetical protein
MSRRALAQGARLEDGNELMIVIGCSLRLASIILDMAHQARAEPTSSREQRETAVQR